MLTPLTGLRRSAAGLLALLCAVLLAPPAFAEPDTFGLGNGHNGELTVGAGQTLTINTYARLTEPANAGQSFVEVTDTTGFAVGDLVMVYQSTGYAGPVTSGNQGPFDFSSDPVGRWQFARVTALTDTRLTFGSPLTVPFLGGPDDDELARRSAAQAIRVPEYTTVTVSAGGSIVAKGWSNDEDQIDSLGGIVVFLAQGAVINNGTISANGAGFRGATYFNGDGDNCTEFDEVYPGGAIKGEGVVPGRFKLPAAYPDADGITGRGNILNAGGAGICHNSGGGGGGNGGQGGIGGRTWTGDTAPARAVGGLGGAKMNFLPPTRVLFGGGGGSGHGNDGVGGGGGNAGGAVFIRGGSLAGAGVINADGAAGGDSDNDAAGGGGAGGTLSLRFNGNLTCNPGNISAKGGRGGISSADEHGTGGGAGGGNIFLQGATINCNTVAATATSGGAAGTQALAGSIYDGATYGSAAGNVGVVNTLTSALTVPAAPVVTTPANGSTTSNRTPAFTGTGPVNTTIVVIVDNVEIGRTTSDASGNWTFTPTTQLSVAAHTVYAYAEVNGQASPKSNTNAFTITAAATPTVAITTPATGSTVSNPNVTVTGTAANATSVTVTFQGTNYPATLTGNTWSVALPGPLANGTYTVTAVSSNGTTNSTQASSTFTVAGPTVVITTPATGSTVSNPNVTVTGTAANATSVTVTFQGTNYPATLTGNTWTAALPGPLANGTYTVTAVSSNGTTNSTQASSTFTVAGPTVAITTPATGSTTSNPNVTVTGTAANATSVTVTFQGTNYPATLTGNTWTAALPGPLANGTYTVTAVSSNGTTNSTQASSTFTVNVPAPTVAISTPANGSTVSNPNVTVTGTAANATSVTVTFNGTNYPATLTGGNWTVALPGPLADGTYTVTAVSTNSAGTNSPTATTNFTVDQTPPTVAIDAPVDGAILNTPNVTVEGSSSGASYVTLTVGAASYGPITVNGDGSWSFPLPGPLAEGSYTATAVATDAAGNTSTTATTNFTVDLTAPTVEISTPGDGDVIGTSTVTVTGTATGATSVTLTYNGTDYGPIPVDGSGNWSYQLPVSLPEGSITVTAVATDAAGNTSTPDSTTFTVDLTVPTVAISNPLTGTSVNTGTVTVTGTTTNATSVTLTFGAASYGPITVNGDGTWSYTLPGSLAEGTYTVTAVSVNGAGTTSATATTNFTVDLTAPTVEISTPGDGDVIGTSTVTVTGTATGATSVTLTYNGTDYGPIPVDGSGNWSYQLPVSLPEGSITVTAVATDAAGNTSTPDSTTFTVDLT
ncbi:Ig-like domain-containing protein, partial [Corallococcus sp. AB011P]|uniref:adventurous gliding motility protein AgmC n=1 Tax=Corallococcus sp. AB011P TaxID=2316735 RepID=UPI0018F4C86E